MHIQMYFLFKPGQLKFGKSSCLKDKTSEGGLDFISDSLKLGSHQHDIKLFTMTFT